MDEIVSTVAERAGVSKDTARLAVEAVVAVLKERLPEPLSVRIDAVLSGDGGLDAGSLMQGLGGLLGRK